MPPKKSTRTIPAQELSDVISNSANVKDYVVNWSRRGGKTHYCIHDIILPFAYYIPDSRIAYITSTLRHAKDIMWQPLLTALGPLVKKRNIGEGRIIISNQSGGESTIQLMGWQTVDSIRGTANDVVIYDETQLLGDFFASHSTAVMPTMATTKGRRFYLFTPLGFNHAYELANTAKENDTWHYSEANWKQFKHIDPKFMDNEEARMTESEFSQEYMCQFIKPDGLVLDAFKNDIHVYGNEIIGTIKRTICGVDFGYGSGNTAIIKAEITKDENGKDVYWISKEVYKRGSELQTYQIAEMLAEMKPSIVWADSADPQRVTDLARTGLPVQPVQKFNNYKGALIARVNQAIKQDRVKINEDLKSLLSEINMWFWNVTSDIVRPDKSTKHDAIDALLYLIGSNEENQKTDKVVKKKKKKIKLYKPVSL